MSEWSSDLYRKYNVPAPRYTSYPTVPYWERTPDEGEWLQHLESALEGSGNPAAGAALYIHIPFCESLCSFCGCNTRITKNHAVGLPYAEVVGAEWQIYRRKMSTSQKWPLAELHLGGGTPTFLSSDELRALLEPILEDVEYDDSAEFSVEVDPRVTTKEQLAALYQLGFRRLSMGVQGFDPEMQKLVNRIQPFDLVKQCLDDARELGYGSINFDLIYGLPKQSEQSVDDTFDKVMLLRPDRVAYYSYAHVPWIKPMHRKFTEEDLPDAATKRALYERGRALLESAGYREVGMDHFALESDSLWKAAQTQSLHRNFMGYIPRRVSPLIGLGVSAIGDSGQSFVQNEKILERYRARVEDGELPILRGHILDREDQLMRGHIMDLMTRFETSFGGDEGDLSKSLAPRLKELIDDGLVELSAEKVSVTARGRPFLRNVAMAFDARLNRKMPDTELFSQSV